MIEEPFDKSDRKMDEYAIDMEEIEQRPASLKPDARQPRFAMEKTCQQTRRLANARRVPLLQFNQNMELAVLPTGSTPTPCV